MSPRFIGVSSWAFTVVELFDKESVGLAGSDPPDTHRRRGESGSMSAASPTPATITHHSKTRHSTRKHFHPLPSTRHPDSNPTEPFSTKSPERADLAYSRLRCHGAESGRAGGASVRSFGSLSLSLMGRIDPNRSMEDNSIEVLCLRCARSVVGCPCLKTRKPRHGAWAFAVSDTLPQLSHLSSGEERIKEAYYAGYSGCSTPCNPRS